MFRRGISFVAAQAVILGFVFACPNAATAQRHGGGSTSGGYGLAGISRPDGVSTKDDLKDFHDAMAVQATGPQITEYAALVKSTEAAKGALQGLLQQSGDAAEFTRRDGVLNQALAKVRGDNKKFVDELSAEQKSGLREFTKRLAKAESDLALEASRQDQATQVSKAGSEVATHAQTLDKALADFSTQQLALGREMGIILANGQDLTFALPQVNSPVNIGTRTVAVGISGELSQTTVQDGQRTFKLTRTADLSDLQQNIAELLSAQLDSSELCGQRVAIRQARLTPSTPASLLVVRLHFERWTCTRFAGQQSSNELAEGDGTVEVKLTATMEKSELKLTSEFGRIDAGGMLADSLRSGSLGEDLRDKITQLLLSAMRAGADFKTLPPAVQNSTTIQSAKFDDAGAGVLRATLGGQVQISNEQADQLASQLNQALSAQGSAGR